eukprot:7390027-Prymnesium_polylepis.1
MARPVPGLARSFGVLKDGVEEAIVADVQFWVAKLCEPLVGDMKQAVVDVQREQWAGQSLGHERVPHRVAKGVKARQVGVDAREKVARWLELDRLVCEAEAPNSAVQQGGEGEPGGPTALPVLEHDRIELVQRGGDAVDGGVRLGRQKLRGPVIAEPEAHTGVLVRVVDLVRFGHRAVSEFQPGWRTVALAAVSRAIGRRRCESGC